MEDWREYGARHNFSELNAYRLAATLVLIDKYMTGRADEFVERVLRGTGLEEGTPWYVLRERLMKNSISKAKLSKPYVMALCIKAWNHARAGTKVRFLRWREEGEKGEQFPVVR